jgi:hypothetical protein
MTSRADRDPSCEVTHALSLVHKWCASRRFVSFPRRASSSPPRSQLYRSRRHTDGASWWGTGVGRRTGGELEIAPTFSHNTTTVRAPSTHDPAGASLSCRDVREHRRRGSRPEARAVLWGREALRPHQGSLPQLPSLKGEVVRPSRLRGRGALRALDLRRWWAWSPLDGPHHGADITGGLRKRLAGSECSVPFLSVCERACDSMFHVKRSVPQRSRGFCRERERGCPWAGRDLHIPPH